MPRSRYRIYQDHQPYFLTCIAAFTSFPRSGVGTGIRRSASEETRCHEAATTSTKVVNPTS